MRNTILNQKTGVFIVSLIFLAVPSIAFGAGLIPCGNPEYIDKGVTIPAQPPCDFNYLIVMANTIIRFLMIDVAVPLAALGIMWTGGSLILNQDKESAWSDAKSRFGDIGMGFGIMLGAFVLIKFILLQFLSTDQASLVNFLIE